MTCLGEWQLKEELNWHCELSGFVGFVLGRFSGPVTQGVCERFGNQGFRVFSFSESLLID